MDEQAHQQAFVSALVTEHFVLQPARSTTVTEANGRAGIYLASFSSALVAFGFVAQVANQLDPFMAAVLAALFVLGEFTFIRLVENSMENLVFLEQIQRIRRYYAGLVPEGAGVLRVWGRDAAGVTGRGWGRRHRGGQDGDSPGEHRDGRLAGGVGIALLVQWLAGIGATGAGLVGVVATLVVFGLYLVWESRRGDAVLGRNSGRPRLWRHHVAAFATGPSHVLRLFRDRFAAAIGLAAVRPLLRSAAGSSPRHLLSID